jgi:hypothetical protein
MLTRIEQTAQQAGRESAREGASNRRFSHEYGEV